MTHPPICSSSKTCSAIFTVFTSRNGVETLKAIEENPDINLVVLDLNMPVMDGFELLNIFKSDKKYANIRVIILTNLDEVDNEIRGLELGAVDYIRKPVNIRALRIRIGIHRKLLNMQHQLEESNSILDARVAKATEELVLTWDITIHALVGLIEARNFESYNHIMRTSMMMKALCNHLKKNTKFADVLTRDYILELTRTSPLHHIGKVAIPDNVLLKPGKLTPEEYEIMKRHVDYGVLALRKELSEKLKCRVLSKRLSISSVFITKNMMEAAIPTNLEVKTFLFRVDSWLLSMSSMP